ncbi:MAG: glycosyltransferase family 25 protein [Flavobacteriales bacterium]
MSATFPYPVFVIHTRANKGGRRDQIIAQLQKHQIDFQFMLDADIPELSDEVLKKWLSGNMLSQGANATTSCSIKHLLCMEQCMQQSWGGILVFEDDALLDDRFHDVFHKAMNEVKEMAEGKDMAYLISFENSSFQFVPESKVEKGRVLYAAERSRCAAAYYISCEACRNIMDYVQKNGCHVPIDWFFNVMTEKELLQIYWTHPAVVEQGSHNGSMPSLLDDKQYGWFRSVNFAVQKFVKQHILRKLR